MRILIVFVGLAAPFCFGQVVFHDPRSEECGALLATTSPAPVYLDSVRVFIETDRLFLIKELGKSEIRIYLKENWLRIDQEFRMEEINEGEMVRMPIFLKPLYRGQGYGYEAKFELIRWAFEVAGVSKIRAKISNDNSHSIRLHKKLGFRFYSATPDGAFYDLNREDFAGAPAPSEM